MIGEDRRYLKGEVCGLTEGLCDQMFLNDAFPTDCRRCNIPIVHTLKEVMKCQEQI